MLYLALLWNDSDPERAETARFLLQRFRSSSPDWRTVVEQPGLSVRCRARSGSGLDAVYVLPGRRGVVLGTLFDRSHIDRVDANQSAPTPVVLDESRSTAIVANAGRELIDRYFGQYVAFLHDAPSRRCWVLRDPSGGMPCQWTRISGIDVYFVRLEDCERLSPLSLSMNRHFLLGYLIYNSSCVRETSFNEIESVLPGERIEHRAETRARTFVWNPLDVAKDGVIEDEREAVRMTQQTVRTCVHAWASRFEGILLSLSGGLDSSIVLACLARAPTAPRVVCRTFYLAGPNSDERAFARRAAQRAGFELLEQEAKTDFSARSIRDTVRSLFPLPWPIDTEDDLAESQFLQSRGLTANFTGNGGDEIFFRGGSFPTAVDYAWRHGLRPALISIALDDAALNQASVWRILRRAYRFGVLKRPWHLRQSFPSAHRPLMTDSVKAEARRDLTLWHPLYRDEAGLPPGKLEHAYVLTYGTCRAYDPLRGEDAAALVSPLKSQPMIELSLRTPLYVLRAGGRDRAIARRAFAADVPQEIIARKSKAHGTHKYRTILTRNVSVVRELLLDGFLVREGFLDPVKLEEVLSGQVSRIQSGTMELCIYLAIEAWVRGWRETRRENPSVLRSASARAQAI